MKGRDKQLIPSGFSSTKKEANRCEDDNTQQSRKLAIIRHIWNYFNVFDN